MECGNPLEKSRIYYAIHAFMYMYVHIYMFGIHILSYKLILHIYSNSNMYISYIHRYNIIYVTYFSKAKIRLT